MGGGGGNNLQVTCAGISHLCLEWYATTAATAAAAAAAATAATTATTAATATTTTASHALPLPTAWRLNPSSSSSSSSLVLDCNITNVL